MIIVLEIKHLKTLQTLANTHSINQAAEKLFTTQSALSHQIKLLEAQLGMSLFKRKTHPIEWTPAGELLLRLAHNLLPQIQLAERQLVALQEGEAGRLWVGVDCHTCFEWLLPLLRPFQEKWPTVDLDIVASFQSSELQPLEKLIQQKVDLVITSDPVANNSIDFTALFSYELVAVLPPDSALLELNFLTPEDFLQQTLITYPVSENKLDIFKQFLHPAGIQPMKVSHSELTLMMLQRVESGRGVCVLPKWLLENQADFKHLPRRSIGKEGLWSKLYAATPKTVTDKLYIQELIHLIASKMQL